jgi:hypothetical protein
MLAPGGWGEKNLREYSYSMVMEVDGRIELVARVVESVSVF